MVAARRLRAEQVYDALITLDGDEAVQRSTDDDARRGDQPDGALASVGLNDPRGDEPLDLDGALRRWKGKDIRVELRGPKRERVEALDRDRCAHPPAVGRRCRCRRTAPERARLGR